MGAGRRRAGVYVSIAVFLSLSSVAHAGPGVWTTGGPYGATVHALAINPTSPATLYAGTYGGGVFRSTDSGGTSVAANAGLGNLKVTQGNLRLYPAHTPLPLVSSVNYVAGQTRANNAVVPLNGRGEIAVRCTQASGTAHFVLDVNGYFE